MVVLYNQPNPGRASGPLRILDMHIMFTRAFTPREFFTIGGSAIPRSLPWSFAAAMFASSNMASLSAAPAIRLLE